MQIDVGLLILFAAIVISIIYGYVLIKLGAIRRPSRRPITGAGEFVRFSLLRKGEVYAKMVEGVLHRDLFFKEEFANILKSLGYPVFIIFGPNLCWETGSFLKVLKDKDNIRLYQFLETRLMGIPKDELKHLLTIRKKHCMVVDGIHCFVEDYHLEHEAAKGGIEFEDNVDKAAKYEDYFNSLINYCEEVDRDHIIRSVGLDNIYIVVNGKYQPVSKLPGEDAHSKFFALARKIGEEEDMAVLWTEYRKQTAIENEKS